ncbi:MAG: glycosyl transferase family 1, partial [Methanomicrobia archaeon]|nr:glycosyl transferase family 1 [Methanomicrobia archaeon]
MKKVIMLLSNPFKPDPRVYKEAKSLVNNGYDVTVFAWDRECKYPKKEIIDGIKIERVRLKAPYDSNLLLFFLLPLWQFIVFLKVLNRKY